MNFGKRIERATFVTKCYGPDTLVFQGISAGDIAMIALRSHDAKDYAKLPDIDAPGIGALTDDDRGCLNDLGDYLVRSEAHRRFGASLLHSHFPVESGETLVEEVDLGNAVLTVKPKRVGIPSAATNMCFEGDDSFPNEIRLVGLEFASDRELCGVSPIDESDSDVLTNLRQILLRHGKLQRFGIRLLHNPLNLEGRVLLESCDYINRVLKCRITTAHDPDFRQSVPTTFSWKATNQNETDLAITMTCESTCWSATSCESEAGGGHKGKVTHKAQHSHEPGPA